MFTNRDLRIFFFVFMLKDATQHSKMYFDYIFRKYATTLQDAFHITIIIQSIHFGCNVILIYFLPFCHSCVFLFFRSEFWFFLFDFCCCHVFCEVRLLPFRTCHVFLSLWLEQFKICTRKISHYSWKSRLKHNTKYREEIPVQMKKKWDGKRANLMKLPFDGLNWWECCASKIHTHKHT